MEEVEQDLRFLGRDDEDDLTKLLLQELCGRGGSPLELYRKYLSQSLNLNIAHGNIAELPDDVLMSFFQKHRLASPKLLNFRNGADLGRLETILNLRIVVVRDPATASSPFCKIHDRRCFDTAFRRGQNAKKVHFFLLRRKEDHWEMFAGPLSRSEYTPSLSEFRFIARGTMVQQCLLESACLLLQLQFDNHEHNGSCMNMVDFCNSAETLRLVGDQQVVVVTHTRSQLVLRGMFAAKKQHFARLGLIRKRGELLRGDARVLCYTAEGRMYIPHPEFARQIVSFPSRLGGSKNDAPPGTEHLKLRGPKSKNQASEEEPLWRNHCIACQETIKYEHNIPRDGPQKLLKMRLSTFDLLAMLSLSRFVPAVKDCCVLSSAYFDLESCSQMYQSGEDMDSVEMEFTPIGGEKLPRREFCSQRPILAGITDGLQLREGEQATILVSDGQRGGSDRMIRHLAEEILERRDRALVAKNELLFELNCIVDSMKKCFYEFYTSKKREHEHLSGEEEEEEEEEDSSSCSYGDEEAAEEEDLDISDLEEGEEEQYFSAAPTEPKKKKGDRLKSVAELRETRERRNRMFLEKAWKYSPFGMLETNLKALSQRFVVWTFHGARYDMVLVSATFSIFFREREMSVRIRRQGNAIKSISVDGIQITDMAYLLPAGCSLAKFREMTGVTEAAKWSFPFDLVDEQFVFLRQQQLPPRAEQWKSRLTGLQPTQELVDEAIKAFKENNCKSNLDFLIFYLKNDVAMTGLGFEKMSETFFEIFNLHILDSARLTISSFSAYASQVWLMRQKSMGHFSPTDQRMYSILKRGMRGGANFCARGVAGSAADMTDYVRMYREMQVWKENRPPEDQHQRQQQNFFNRPPPDLRDDAAIERYLRGCNANWIENPEESLIVWYSDAIALYGAGKPSPPRAVKRLHIF
jgi:hypothetical protein